MSIQLVNSRRNQYGPRVSDELVVGEIANGGYEKEAIFRIAGSMLSAASTSRISHALLGKPIMPKSALVVALMSRIIVPMTSSGTTPSVSITSAAGAVLGTLSAAQLAAAAGTVVSIIGTAATPFDAPLAADQLLEVRAFHADNVFLASGIFEIVAQYRYSV